MIRRVLLAALALALSASCTTASLLSRSAYDHEQRAARLRAQGSYEAAAAQQVAANHDRYKLARIGRSFDAAYPRL